MSHMIMVHELPFMFAKYEVFNMLMKQVSRSFQPVSCTTSKIDCVTSYGCEKKKVLDLL